MSKNSCPLGSAIKTLFVCNNVSKLVKTGIYELIARKSDLKVIQHKNTQSFNLAR